MGTRLLVYSVQTDPGANLISNELIFLIGVSGGGVQLGPLSTEATDRPIVPARGDYDDGEICGMMIGRGNRSTRKTPGPVPLCPPQTSHALPGREPGPPRWEASDKPLELRHAFLNPMST
jgi:hypothetical protein